ncbi:hypothetical protein C162_20406 [Paenibacillus sp. FSL R7-269]|uniref:hypothetical protein n=1 Tax=Paenibacillus sp. FSL R7-269 TaxID=1226755 RepID=UPI0003E20E5F|nr:hypothetical protein [Paenibacillus sp. FSL R7-269]ETT45733.1 hypothetical protein C162_20406 [Paenibacillus sp. FSL R7-269]
MTFRKMKRWAKIVYSLLFIFAVLGLLSLLGVLIFLAFFDEKVLTNTVIINRITLVLAGISLPGLAVQLISFLTLNEKKTYTMEANCPNCRQLVDFKLTED